MQLIINYIGVFRRKSKSYGQKPRWGRSFDTAGMSAHPAKAEVSAPNGQVSFVPPKADIVHLTLKKKLARRQPFHSNWIKVTKDHPRRHVIR